MVTLMTSQPTSTTAPAQGASGDAQHSPRRWWALIAIAASVLVVGLDLTVLNLALPDIAVSLHASTGDLQWFSDAYSLVIAAMILPAGLLGDRYGRKRVLLIALVLFGAASALCAFATSTGELIGARALLGVGASAIFPMSLSVLPTLFAPEERRKAIAIMSAATMLSFPIGPILGGYLLDHFWWGSVFLINVPVVVIALVAVCFLLPESRSANRPSIDVPGVLISSAGLIAVTYGCIKAGQNGWGNPTALATIAVGLAALAGFVGVERRITARGGQSLVDLFLFKSVGFRWGTVLVTFLSFAMFGLFFALPQYFQDVRGASSLGSGLRLLPMVAGMVVGMVVGTRLQSVRGGSDRAPGRGAMAGPRAVITAGYLVIAVALALGAFTTLSSSTWFTLAWVAVSGLGFGLVMPAAMNVTLASLTAERSGSGSALISAMRQVGSVIGVAILGTLISNAYGSRVDATGLPAAAADLARTGVAGGVEVAHSLASTELLDSVRSAFVDGMDIMLWTCAGIALGCAMLAVILLRKLR
jgi:DHA2 family multidrug resistance protein-like MFS transporter